MDCYCDYVMPEFFSCDLRTARKPHRCDACGADIAPGQQYENVAGKWEGEFERYQTCADCLELREWVLAHVPCFCWTYDNLFDDARETLAEHVHHVPGLGMEGGRMLVAMRRRLRFGGRRRWAA